jgi:hypothetical protein
MAGNVRECTHECPDVAGVTNDAAQLERPLAAPMRAQLATNEVPAEERHTRQKAVFI